jgi:light-regulated signal transduction histidine kinase (bacteriophytochrome)
VDTSTCDNEPIHIPGAIQPHGLLIVVSTAEELVEAIAGDPRRLLGCLHDPIGQSLKDLLGRSLVELTHDSGFQPHQEPLFLSSHEPEGGGPQLDIIAHERHGAVVIELEPMLADRLSGARLLARLRASVANIKQQATIADACHVAAAEVRNFTGHDRALAYELLEDGTGRVIAEERNKRLPSLLNQHFPASDIPAQARALYRRNLVRVIPDVHYEPAPLQARRPCHVLDMSDCSLRSVSPVHIQYLKNMGVGSSMSVSIVREDALWGLIACHSADPRLVPYEVREVCKQLSTALAQQLDTLAALSLSAEASRLANGRERILAGLAGSQSVEADLRQRLDQLARIIPCDGIVLCYNGAVTRWGEAPDDAQCLRLAEWVRRKDDGLPVASAALASDYPDAAAFADIASGLLGFTAYQEDPIELVWLRQEYAQVVEWAGNPNDHVGVDAATGQLTPRNSFEVWRETVRGRSLPWSSAIVDTAQRLRDGIERIKERQRLRALQASVIHMSRVNAMGAMASSIAHEVNQPLAAVASYTRAALAMLQNGASAEEVEHVLRNAAGQSLRAGEIIRHLRQLVAPVRSAVLPVSLAAVVEEACSIGLMDAARQGVRLACDVPPGLTVMADSIQVQQVLLNLIRNSLDATEGQAERRISIRAVAQPDGSAKLTACDNGPGVSAEVQPRLFEAFSSTKSAGLGIGLSICRTIIEAHGGKIALEKGDGTGACFSFTLQGVPPGGAQPLPTPTEPA